MPKTSTRKSPPRPPSPEINTAVNDVRKAGEIFLPVDSDESSKLSRLLPGFKPSYSSAFDSPRYQVPDTAGFQTFRCPSTRRPEVGKPPAVFYPIALAESYPATGPDSDTLVLADGRILYLAISFILKSMLPIYKRDSDGAMVSPVKNSKLLKDCLEIAYPALVRYIHFSFVYCIN